MNRRMEVILKSNQSISSRKKKMGDKSAYMGVGGSSGGGGGGYGYAREEYAYGGSSGGGGGSSGGGGYQQQASSPGVTKPRTDVSCYLGP